MGTDNSACNKILLLLIGRLGDYIITTPFLEGLRKKYPAAEITLITSKKAENLASNNSDIDRLIVFKGWHDLPGTIRVFTEAMKRCDLALDLNPAYSRTSLWIMSLSKARERMTFEKKAPAGTYTALIPHDLANDHFMDKYVSLAARLGFTPPESMRITLSRETMLKGEKLFKGLGLPLERLAVAIHPGNFKKFENRWPEEKFVEFTKALLKMEDLSVFYIEGPGEEKETEEKVLRFLPGVKHLPPMPLEIAAAVLKQASILVCNNTGTLHLAAAAGTPTFSFNRPYTERCWKPRGKDHYFLTSKTQKSCRDIEVAEALKAFRHAADVIIAGRKAARPA
jgi:ADP-heptose:LPS heptosyltransferase